MKEQRVLQECWGSAQRWVTSSSGTIRSDQTKEIPHSIHTKAADKLSNQHPKKKKLREEAAQEKETAKKAQQARTSGLMGLIDQDPG